MRQQESGGPARDARVHLLPLRNSQWRSFAIRAKAYAVYGLPPSSPTAADAGHGLWWRMCGLIDMLFAWYQRARQHRALLTLDDCILKDISISRADAKLEANKPFWRC